MRRASATAMTTQRPPLPSSIGNRSQSLDELLDTSDDTPAPERASEQKASDASGAGENSKSNSSPNSQTDNDANENEENAIDATSDVPPRRPSRSERAKSVSVDRERNPEKSKETETGGLDSNETASMGSINSLNPSRPSPSNQFDETSSTNNQDDTKSISNSTTGSQGSESSDKKRTLLNRYVKKVKSFIKK